MMKKIIAAAFITTVGISATTANAAVFNGFGMGVGAGLTIATAEFKGPYHKYTDSEVYGIYQIVFEYEKSRANCFYWGMGLDGSLYFSKNEHIGKLYNWSSELDARFGYNICNRGAIYGIFGLKLYQYKSNNDVNLAPVFGAGGKLRITNHISLGLEYKYALEKKYHYNHGKTVDLNSHTILTKVSYHF